jgi:hypothetical protein
MKQPEVDVVFFGCGAVHVLWEDLAEFRTVAVDPDQRGRRIARRRADPRAGRRDPVRREVLAGAVRPRAAGKISRPGPIVR